VIQRLALCQRTPRRRPRVARIVSPETRLPVSPSSKLTCAAISSVQRLLSLPNSLGERCSISLMASALSSSKAEGGAGSLWARGAGHQSVQATLVEIVDGITHRLLPAAQVLSYLRDFISP
jgi:hypothetical protein